MALNPCTRKEERSKINYLKKPEKEEQRKSLTHPVLIRMGWDSPGRQESRPLSLLLPAPAAVRKTKEGACPESHLSQPGPIWELSTQMLPLTGEHSAHIYFFIEIVTEYLQLGRQYWLIKYSDL